MSMSLGALGTYGDIEEDEKKEDKDKLLEYSKQSLAAVKPPSRPSSDIEGSNKPKGLVSYIGGDFSDDDSSSESETDDAGSVASRPSVVNLGLHDASNQLSSVDSASPASITETTDNLEPTKEEATNSSAKLPPEPPGRCSKMLQEKIIKMLERKNRGMNVNEYVQKKKAFRNPSIYEKLVSYIGIDEHGTNFPKHIYNPDMWGPESYYDALAKAQKEYHEKKEKERRESKRTQVEFVTGTKKPPSANPVPTVPDKKSKWDQGPIVK